MFKILIIELFEGGTYGPRCLSSFLKTKGFEVYSIFSKNLIQFSEINEAQTQATLNLIRELNPDLIGLSLVSILSHQYYEEFVARIKKIKKIPIVAGGAYPSSFPEALLQQENIDFVCLGEGEESFSELCGALSAGRKTEGIPGIVSKEYPTTIKCDPPQELDLLPFQDVSSKGMYYVHPDGKTEEKDVFFLREEYPTKVSRGCIFRCSYCENNTLRNLCSTPSKYYRVRSVQNVISELRRYIEEINPNAKKIWFADDSFPSLPAWVEEFSASYKEHIDLPFRTWFNPNVITESNIVLLKKAGLYRAEVGIQSAVDHTRKEIYLRSETIEKFLEIDRMLTSHGIFRQYDFLVGHPWEDAEERKKIFFLLKKCKLPIPYINFHSLLLFPGTALEARAVNEGFIDRQENFQELVCKTSQMRQKVQWRLGPPDENDVFKTYWTMLALMLQRKNPFFWICATILACPLVARQRSVAKWIPKIELFAKRLRRNILCRFIKKV